MYTIPIQNSMAVQQCHSAILLIVISNDISTVKHSLEDQQRSIQTGSPEYRDQIRVNPSSCELRPLNASLVTA